MRYVFSMMMLVSVAAGATELDMLPLGDSDRAFELGSAEAGTFYDCSAGASIGFDELVARMAGADVVLLGEEHTSMDQKVLHARLVEGMAASGKKLVLAMEFFLRDDQDSLDRWLRGEIDDRALLEETGWYDRGGYRWEYYRPVMEVARTHGMAIVGANVSRDIPRTVNRQGLDGLSEEQREQVGEVTTSGFPQHSYLISRYFGDTVALLPPGWFENMYAAQCLWDVVMARSILQKVGEDTTVVLVVGSGHVAYDLGIPRRLDDERAALGLPPLDVVSFCPVTAPAPDPDGEPTGHPMGGGGHGMGEDAGPPAQFTRSLADYVGSFADNGGIEAFPTLGLRLKTDDDGGTVVSMVWPDTPAEELGFASGDAILDVNGMVPESLGELRFMLATMEWGRRFGLLIGRGEEQLEIAALLYPTTDTSESSTAPGYVLERLEPFVPSGEVVVTDLEPVEQSTRWTRVVADDGPDRVEVRTDLLDEVHELDDNGRVEMSLYRTPLEDGTVELRYERDETGKVTQTQRFDRTGAEID
jgi:uncharacterized iron-regulated protein